MRPCNQVKHTVIPWALGLFMATVYLQMAIILQWLFPHVVGKAFLTAVLLTSFSMVVTWFMHPLQFSRWLMPWRMVKASEQYQVIAQALSRRARLTPPVLMGVSHSPALAYAIGAQPQRSLLGLDEAFLSAMKPQEVEAIIAHEMGHIVLGHTRQLTLLQGALVLLIVPLAALGAGVAGLLRGHWARPVFFSLLSVLPYLLLPLTSLFVMLVMRRWEYAADRYAADLVGKPAVLATLRCLHGVFMPENSWNQVTAFDDRRMQRLLRPFTSHPSIPQRITALWRQ